MTKVSQNNILELPGLPEGWAWAKVGDLADNIHYGYTESATEEPVGPKFLRITDIQDNSVNWESAPYCKIENFEKEKYLLKDGDLVFARTGATVGKSFLIVGEIPEAVFASYLIRILLNCNLNKEYVYNFFQSLSYWTQISEGKLGIGQPNVNAQILSQIIVPLPPLPEQKRIVAKIEELFTRLDAGVEALRKVKAEIKRYRQAVLKHAFEGRLTEKWRVAHKGELESASVLLKRIKEERKKNAKSKYKELPPVDASELPTPPKGWVWTRFDEICCNITKGSTPTSYGFSYKKNGINFIKTENITEEGNIGSISDFIDQETNLFLRRSILQANDVLFSIAGTIGRIGLIREKNLPANTNQALAIIRCFWDFIDNKYVFFFLKSPGIQKHTLKSIVGVGRANVSLSNLADFIIPLPPLPEQHKIVEEIERRFSIADEVEATVDQSLTQAQRLRQSILKRAFEGRLVPQDPTDEPASALLERIRLNKESKEGKIKTGRRKPRGEKSAGMA